VRRSSKARANKPREGEGVSAMKARAKGATVLSTNAVIASAAKQSRVFPRWDFWIASLRSQ
jgi:hypothetical protein